MLFGFFDALIYSAAMIICVLIVCCFQLIRIAARHEAIRKVFSEIIDGWMTRKFKNDRHVE